MTTTPQTNATLQEIANELLQLDNIVIAGHVSPDGDCIGSQLALMHALKSYGKNVVPVLASKRTPPFNLSSLPGFDQLVYAGTYTGPVGAFVAVDVPNVDRLDVAQAALLERAPHSFTIDHHASLERMTQLAYIDPSSASASMLVWQLIKYLGVDPTPEAAICAYTGVMTDTTSFRNQNTTAACFTAAREMVACGANASKLAADIYLNRSKQSLLLESLAVSRMQFAAGAVFVVSYITRADMKNLDARPEDADVIVDTLRSVRGVRVACFMKEILIDNEVVVKGSLRAKDDTDVSVIARKYNGGGHKGASGFKMFCSMEEAMQTICAEFEEYLSGSGK